MKRAIVVEKQQARYKVVWLDGCYYTAESSETLVNAMISGRLKVLNYEVHGSSLVYTQGSELKIKSSGESTEDRVFILAKDSEAGAFQLLMQKNGEYKTLLANKKQIEKLYNSGYNVINAKVVTRGEDIFISAIKGNFPEIDLGLSKPKQTQETKQAECESDYDSGVKQTDSISKSCTSKSKHTDSEKKQEDIEKKVSDRPIIHKKEDIQLEINKMNRKSTDDILDTYGDDLGLSGKEVSDRVKQSKYNSLIKRALLVGMALTLAATMTGCKQASGATQAEIDKAIEASGLEKVADPMSLLESTNKISVNAKLVSLSFDSTITVDENIVGVINGKTVKLMDEIIFQDIEGNIVITAKEKFNILTKANNWEIYGADGNLTHNVESKLHLLKIKLVVSDTSGTEIATISSDVFNLTGIACGTMMDKDGNIVATIKGNLTKDYTIEFSEENACPVDKKTAATLISCYMISVSETSRNNGSHSNSSRSK